MRKSWIVLMLFVLALTVAACGGDSGGDSGNDAPDTASDDSEGDPDAFCAASQDFARAIGSGTQTPDFDAMDAALGEMEASAPEEIKADVTTVRDALGKATDGDPSAMDAPDVQAANDRIFQHLEDSDCEPPDDA